MTVEPYIQPKLHDKVAQDLSSDFLTQFSWLEQCYGIAQVGIVEREGAEFRFPVVYRNDGTTYQKELHPDQGLQSFGFFELNAPYSMDFSTGFINYSLNFIAWLNLPLIDSRTDDFTSILIDQVVTRLNNLINVISINVETRHENIFNRYDYNQTEKQFLKYPFSGFKVGFDFTDMCN